MLRCAVLLIVWQALVTPNTLYRLRGVSFLLHLYARLCCAMLRRAALWDAAMCCAALAAAGLEYAQRSSLLCMAAALTVSALQCLSAVLLDVLPASGHPHPFLWGRLVPLQRQSLLV